MKRLFEKLSCPILHLVDDIDNPSSQAAILGWMEDRKIREYEVEERHTLRIVSPEWSDSVSAYLQSLHCPVREWLPQNDGKLPSNNRRALQWLASYALSLDFEDYEEAKTDQAAIGEDASKMDEDDNVPVSVSTDIQALLHLGEPFGLHIHTDESIAGKFMMYLIM